MCLAIVTPGNDPIPFDHLENGFAANPHGAGFAVWDQETRSAIALKGFATFESFWAAYRPHMEKRGIVHFRFATHGGNGMEFTHPFRLKDGGYLIHNGVITDHRMGANDHDTEFYIKRVLSVLPNRWYMNPVYRELVGDNIGSYNKFAILGPNGEYAVINPDAWESEGERWYSNKGYEKPKSFIGNIKYWGRNKKNSTHAKSCECYHCTMDKYDHLNDRSDYFRPLKTEEQLDQEAMARLSRGDLLLSSENVMTDCSDMSAEEEQRIADADELAECYRELMKGDE